MSYLKVWLNDQEMQIGFLEELWEKRTEKLQENTNKWWQTHLSTFVRKIIQATPHLVWRKNSCWRYESLKMVIKTNFQSWRNEVFLQLFVIMVVQKVCRKFTKFICNKGLVPLTCKKDIQRCSHYLWLQFFLWKSR